MDVGEDLRTVALLLADGWQGRDGGKLDVQAGGLIGVAEGDVMATRPGRRIELSEDAMIRVLLWCILRGFGNRLVCTRTRKRVRRSCARQKSS